MQIIFCQVCNVNLHSQLQLHLGKKNSKPSGTQENHNQGKISKSTPTKTKLSSKEVFSGHAKGKKPDLKISSRQLLAVTKRNNGKSS